MKQKFESILLQLKSNLKSPSVINELKTDYDKQLHEKLINIVNRYYENIDLFDIQKENLQELLFDNANNLLEKTNSTSFNLYLSNYRNYANFLIDNYYENKDNFENSNKISSQNINKKSISEKFNELLMMLSNEKENIDIEPEKFSLDKKEFDLIIKELINKGFIRGQKFLSGEYLFQGLTFNGIKYLEELNFKEKVSLPNNINLIDKKEFEKRYMGLVSLLNSENNESNLILYTKVENKPFKLYKNSNNSIFIKAGLETKNMSLPLNKCILIIYENEETPFKSYTDVLFPKILDNTIFDEIIINAEVSVIGSEISTFGGVVKVNIKENSIIYNNPISGFHSDVPSYNNIDCLNIDKDVNAFAKLIANNSLQPPLAIGLFGKWGSGKSFFMEELERKIKKLSDEENSKKVFHEKIVHIKFNAWHYSDSNLWANLMIQIFEKLNEFLKPKETDKIESLYLQLESTKELLQEKEEEKNILESKINSNKEELKNKTNQKIEKVFNLNQLKDLTKLVLKDGYIKTEINNIKKDIPSFKNKSIDEIYIKLNYDLNKNTGIIKKFLKFLLNDKQFQTYLILGIFLILSILGILKYMDIFKEWFLSFIFIPFGIYFNRFKEVTARVSKFVEFYETLKEKNMKDDIELSLLKEQANLESELIILEETISFENKRLEEISFEIEHIKSGKYLADFIMERANSNDYKQHLGLISLIRNDLEKLNDYLKQPVKDAKHKIDRIVLYIDDLDRCSEDKVMDVLEAIHLLLAFDLFVVIVGVDTRWIKKSLEEKRNLEKDNNENLEKDNKESVATSKEYLEKIFQIPFHLQNMEEDIKKQLVKKLLEKDLEKENFENKSEDLNTNSFSKQQNVNDNSDNPENSNLNNTPLDFQEDLYKDLKIAQYEYDYILEVAKFLGESPRTIKRFVNIYRLVRSHEYILKELLTNFEEQYKFITMLLCLNDKIDLKLDNYLEKVKELNFAEIDKENFERFTKKDELFKFISRFSFRDCK